MAMKTFSGDPDRRNRRWRPWLAVLAATMLVSAGCGNRESKDEAGASRPGRLDRRRPRGSLARLRFRRSGDGAAPAPDAAAPDAPAGRRAGGATAAPAAGVAARRRTPLGEEHRSSAAPAPAAGGSGNASQPASVVGRLSRARGRRRNGPGSHTRNPRRSRTGRPGPRQRHCTDRHRQHRHVHRPGRRLAQALPRRRPGVGEVDQRPGGLNGHPVKLIVVDDGGDPARHKAAKQDLVERKGVQAFVGDGEPLAGESSVDYITSKGIPMVGNEGGSDWYHKSPMYFPQAPNGDTYWHSMMPGLAEVTKGKKKFGVGGLRGGRDGLRRCRPCVARRGHRQEERLRSRLPGPGLAGPAGLHRRMPGRPAGGGRDHGARPRRHLDRPVRQLLRPAALQPDLRLAAGSGRHPPQGRPEPQRRRRAAQLLPLDEGRHPGHGRVPGAR